MLNLLGLMTTRKHRQLMAAADARAANRVSDRDAYHETNLRKQMAVPNVIKKWTDQGVCVLLERSGGGFRFRCVDASTEMARLHTVIKDLEDELREYRSE